MKKFILILISIFLLLSSFTLGFFVKKSIDDNTILNLLNAKKELESINNNLQNRIEYASQNVRNEENKKATVEEEYKHPIDKKLQYCIEQTHPYLYSDCALENSKAWDQEIQNQLKRLKTIMTTNDYQFIINSQNDWIKSLNSDEIAINKFISSRSGTINETLGFSSIANIKKQRALLLNQIYTNYKDEIELKEY